MTVTISAIEFPSQAIRTMNSLKAMPPRRPDPFYLDKEKDQDILTELRSQDLVLVSENLQALVSQRIAACLDEGFQLGDLHAFAWGDCEEISRKAPTLRPFYELAIKQLDHMLRDQWDNEACKPIVATEE